VILNILPVLLLLLLLLGAKPVTPMAQFDEDYLSKDTCNILRGFFAIVVVFHHLAQRTSSGFLFRDFTQVGFLAVAAFFFFSGYGLQKQHILKSSYSNGFLLKRLPQILIPYIIMTALYWVLRAVLGDVFSLADLFLTIFTDEGPIVSFSWYIISILIFYMGFYLLMKIFKKHHFGMILGGFLYYFLLVFLCRKFSLGIWWYNASHILVFGMIWAVYEDRILSFFKKYYLLITPLILIIFCILFEKQYDLLALFNVSYAPLISAIILTCLFTLSFLLISMKVKLKNKVLSFLGSISLEIYMTHGLFTRGLRNDFLYIQDDSIWVISVITGTIALSFLLHKVFKFILTKYQKIFM